MPVLLTNGWYCQESLPSHCDFHNLTGLLTNAKITDHKYRNYQSQIPQLPITNTTITNHKYHNWAGFLTILAICQQSSHRNFPIIFGIVCCFFLNYRLCIATFVYCFFINICWWFLQLFLNLLEFLFKNFTETFP